MTTRNAIATASDLVAWCGLNLAQRILIAMRLSHLLHIQLCDKTYARGLIMYQITRLLEF